MSGEVPHQDHEPRFEVVADMLAPPDTLNPYLHDAAVFVRRIGRLQCNVERESDGMTWAVGEHALAVGDEELARLIFDNAPLYQKIMLYNTALRNEAVPTTTIEEWGEYLQQDDVQQTARHETAARMATGLGVLENALGEYEVARGSRRSRALSSIRVGRAQLAEAIADGQRSGEYFCAPHVAEIITNRANVSLVRAGFFDRLYVDEHFGVERSQVAYEAIGQALVGRLTMWNRRNLPGLGHVARAKGAVRTAGARAVRATVGRLPQKEKPYDWQKEQARRVEDRNEEYLLGALWAAQRIQKVMSGKANAESIGNGYGIVGAPVFAVAMPRAYEKISAASHINAEAAVAMHVSLGNVHEATRIYARAKGDPSLLAKLLGAALLLSRHEDDTVPAMAGHDRYGSLCIADVVAFEREVRAVLMADLEHPGEGVLSQRRSEIYDQVQELANHIESTGSPMNAVVSLAALLRINHAVNPASTKHHNIVRRANNIWYALEGNETMHGHLGMLRARIEAEGWSFVRRRDVSGYIGFAIVPDFPGTEEQAFALPMQHNTQEYVVGDAERQDWENTIRLLNGMLGEERYTVEELYGVFPSSKQLRVKSNLSYRAVDTMHELSNALKAVAAGQPLHANKAFTDKLEAAYKRQTGWQ